MFDERAETLLDLRRSPPPSALRAAPLTIDQLDAHADRDRFWATILTIRAHVRSDEYFCCIKQDRAEEQEAEDELQGVVGAQELKSRLDVFVKGGFTRTDLMRLYDLLPEGADVLPEGASLGA